MGIIKGAYRPWFIIGDNGGQWDIERQDAGLSEIDFKNKTVLEIGCAEGLVSLQNLKRGARLSHGIEFRERAVEVAKSVAGVLGRNDSAKFFWGDIRNADKALNQSGMLNRYDIVITMAVLQKVHNQPEIFSKLLAKCASTMLLRLPERKLYRFRMFSRQWS